MCNIIFKEVSVKCAGLNQNAACVSPIIFQHQDRLEAYEMSGPWSQKKRVKKSVLNSGFNNLFLLIAAVLSCNEGALSQAFLYTCIFHAQLCFTP